MNLRASLNSQTEGRRTRPGVVTSPRPAISRSHTETFNPQGYVIPNFEMQWAGFISGANGLYEDFIFVLFLPDAGGVF
jgi:hypothetical protein